MKNLYLALQLQMPLKRLIRNFLITGNAWGMFSKYSHTTKQGKPKVQYNTWATAQKAADSMAKKNNTHYSVYKCIYCDGYHIGRNKA